MIQHIKINNEDILFYFTENEKEINCQITKKIVGFETHTTPMHPCRLVHPSTTQRQAILVGSYAQVAQEGSTQGQYSPLQTPHACSCTPSPVLLVFELWFALWLDHSQIMSLRPPE